MTAIGITQFKKYNNFEGEVNVTYLESPATAWGTDTVDLTSFLDGRAVMAYDCWNQTLGTAVTSPLYTKSTDVVTLDPAGGTTDDVFILKVETLR